MAQCKITVANKDMEKNDIVRFFDIIYARTWTLTTLTLTSDQLLKFCRKLRKVARSATQTYFIIITYFIKNLI